MMTFTVVLLFLMVLGVATHFVPALRTGRTGYPRSTPAWPAPDRSDTRTTRDVGRVHDLPLSRSAFEYPRCAN